MKFPCAGLWLCLLLMDCSRSDGNKPRHDPVAADTLIDAAARTVTLPDNVERVVSPFTMYTRLIIALGGCGKLAGISHTCVLPEEARGCAGELLNLPDVGPFGKNIELIASLNPDLIFCSQTDVPTFMEKTNAAIVAVAFPNDVPMADFFYQQIDIIGKALRLQKEADSLKDFIKQKLEMVVSVTGVLPDSVKPRAYFAWTSWTGDILNTLSEFDPIELAGGINVARETKNFAKGERGILVSREHIIKWDPEVIFISRYQPQGWNSGEKNTTLPVTIQDVLSDPLLQGVKAVRNKRVYYTTAFCNWWPHQRALAQVFYMAKIFHPDLFADLDVEREGNAIYQRFYGEDNLYSQMAQELELRP